MNSPDLLMICSSAFAAVFIILFILAVLMRLIITIFPERDEGPDKALIAAVNSTYNALYPGTKITKIEEVK